MTGLLGIANEFIDRMMNPAFGSLVNNDYSMRLGEIVGDDEGMMRVIREAQLLERVDELSSHTWIWLLGTSQAKQQLSRPLLLELCKQFQTAAFRATVIDCALTGEPRLRPGEIIAPPTRLSVNEIANPWLLQLVGSVLDSPRQSDEVGLPDREAITDEARNSDVQTLLVALLTVNRRVCQEASASLLHHSWPGQAPLIEFFESRTAAMDAETRALWLRLAPG